MKLQIIILAALVAFAVAQEPESTGATGGVDTADAERKVGMAEETVDKAMEATKKAVEDEKVACAAEIKGTETWISAIDEKKLKKMYERRMADKKALMGAVKDRIVVMQEYLGKLKLARNNLAGVITRVNGVFRVAYEEAVNAQKESANIMALLGLSIGHTYNPGTEFAKIKLPREDAEEAATQDVEPNDGDASGSGSGSDEEEAVDCQDCEKKDAKAPSLMELEAQVHTKMARCKGEYCETAYHHAFDLYKTAHVNAEDDFKSFNEDKKIIAFFKLTVSTLITRKIGRLKNLTKQQADLEAALAAAEGESRGPLAKILDEILVHKKRITDSCAVMGDRSAKMLQQLAALKSCVEGKECSASDSAEKKVEEKAKANEEAPAAASPEPAAPASATGGEEAAKEPEPTATGAMEGVFDSDAKETAKA